MKKQYVYRNIGNAIITTTILLYSMGGNNLNAIASTYKSISPEDYVAEVEKKAFERLGEFFGALVGILGVTYTIKAIWGK